MGVCNERMLGTNEEDMEKYWANGRNFNTYLWNLSVLK